MTRPAVKTNPLAAMLLAILILAGCSPSAPSAPAPEPQPKLIIHVCDRPYVSRDDFAATHRSETDTPAVPDAEIDALYATYLTEVEAVQDEQKDILWHLILYHRIRSMFKEGVTDENRESFRTKARQLREFDAKEVQQKADAETDSQAAARLQADARARRLELGAVGKLMMLGEVHEVLPLAASQSTDKAAAGKTDVTKAGQTTNEAREDEIVRRLVAGGPVVVVVLDGAYDLKTKIEAACPECKYERQEPKAYTEVAPKH